MFFVIAKAQPAEFVFTFFASHMHATLVFLNVGFALRTSLSVYFDPICGIRFIVASNSVKPGL